MPLACNLVNLNWRIILWQRYFTCFTGLKPRGSLQMIYSVILYGANLTQGHVGWGPPLLLEMYRLLLNPLHFMWEIRPKWNASNKLFSDEFYVALYYRLASMSQENRKGMCCISTLFESVQTMLRTAQRLLFMFFVCNIQNIDRSVCTAAIIVRFHFKYQLRNLL